jgi:anti-sigma B factor antagonist
MTIDIRQQANQVTITLAGRLDTITTPQLEAEIIRMDPQVNELVFDLADLNYLSSSGLRVLVSVQKKLAGRGKMIIRNSQQPVRNVFEITGFTDVLNIE